MTIFSRARVLLLALAAVAVLAACNPLTLPGGPNLYSARYSGPSDGWVEVSIVPNQALVVEFFMHIVTTVPPPRLCRDAATGAVEECLPLLGGVVYSDRYDVTSTAFRAVISPRDADGLIVYLTCYLGGHSVGCPSMQVTMRVVDADGDLVGNLSPAEI